MLSKDIKFKGCFQDHDELVQKYIFQDPQGVIEVSHINTKVDRDILCLPTFYGCTLKCKFCHITTSGLDFKMTPIKSSVLLEIINAIPKHRKEKQLSFMGMGDPLLNPAMVNNLCGIFPRTSISTIFPVRTIPDLDQNIKVHYSLHHPIDEIRKRLIPANTLSIKTALKYLLERDTPGEIHYTLIKGINDSSEALSCMMSLIKNFPVVVKFLDFNPTADLEKSNGDVVGKWITSLSRHTKVEFYTPPGRNIGSSCGEFSMHFYKKNALKSFEYKIFEKRYRLF